MARKFIFAAAILAIGTIGFAYAQTKEPENGPELVKVLREKYGVLAHLNRDRQVWMVAVEPDSDVTKAVDRLSNVETIERLTLLNHQLSKDILQKASKLPALTHLRIDGCKFEEADLEAIKEMPKLKNLNLIGTPITDDGLAHLESLKDLKRLLLSRTRINGSGFKHLQSLPLEELNLTATPITDDSLRSIGEIHSLRSLNLRNTPITDNGITHLTGLYLLRTLILNGTQTTHGGRSWFREEYDDSRSKAEENGLVPPNYADLSIGYQ